MNVELVTSNLGIDSKFIKSWLLVELVPLIFSQGVGQVPVVEVAPEKRALELKWSGARAQMGLKVEPTLYQGFCRSCLFMLDKYPRHPGPKLRWNLKHILNPNKALKRLKNLKLKGQRSRNYQTWWMVNSNFVGTHTRLKFDMSTWYSSKLENFCAPSSSC